MLAGIFHKKDCLTEDGYSMLPPHRPSDRHRSVEATHMRQKRSTRLKRVGACLVQNVPG